MGIATVAAWRRRRRACEEPIPLPPPDRETPSDRLQHTAEAVISGPLDLIGANSYEAQRAGLEAILDFRVPNRRFCRFPRTTLLPPWRIGQVLPTEPASLTSRGCR